MVNYRNPIQTAQVERMSALIAHRGPDQAGLYQSPDDRPSVVLATRRLAILDLSVEGSQPMSNETGDLWLAYNGEVYNHQDLRRELEGRNHHYHSFTDTETIIHAFEEWGPAAFARLSGMFACVLHDQKTGKVTLARDGRGIKPLYYTWDGQTLVFASELKALLKANLVRPAIDPTALWLFLCLGYVPSPYCIVSGVRKLEPGHYLELSDGRLTNQSFLTAPADAPLIQDWGEGIDRVRQTVERAVQTHLMSDVPVGVFLSGGLDSTIVATLAAQHHTGPLHSFSIGYAKATGATDIEARYNDDFFAAREIAEQLGTVHHEILVENTSDLSGLVTDLIFQLDEPMVEPVFTSTHYLSKLARDMGVPVVLTGDGADEVFGGYDRYFSAQRLGFYHKVPGLRYALPVVETLGGKREVAHSAHELKYLLEHPSAVDSYIRFSTVYHPEQALELLAPDVRAQVDTTALGQLVVSALGPDRSFPDQMAHADLALWVGEHFNPRLDRISMRHSVEARVPFQDDAVVETALALPMNLKSTRAGRKKLLKQAFADIIPEIALNRPKRSFQAPGAAWLEGGLNTVYNRLMGQPNHLLGLFEPGALRRYAAAWGRGTPGQVFSAWALLTVEQWAGEYVAGKVEQV